MATVGDRIRQRRLELGLSQRAAACEGVSAGYICRLESGDRLPSARVLRSLAARLGVSPYWLETGEVDPAVELARLVIELRGAVLPTRAATLARDVLRRANA